MLNQLHKIINRYFEDLPQWINTLITDPRQKEKIVYKLDIIMFTGILMYLLQLKARRQIKFKLKRPE